MYLTNGGNLNHKKTQYNYSKRMFTRRTKPIRIIGDPDNQLPDKRISTVYVWKHRSKMIRYNFRYFEHIEICSP
jgi:hypothetical protein